MNVMVCKWYTYKDRQQAGSGPKAIAGHALLCTPATPCTWKKFPPHVFSARPSVYVEASLLFCPETST